MDKIKLLLFCRVASHHTNPLADTARNEASNRGEYAALYTMAWSAAQTLGPVGGAQLAEHFGFNILWWAVGGLCFIASICMSRWVK